MLLEVRNYPNPKVEHSKTSLSIFYTFDEEKSGKCKVGEIKTGGTLTVLSEVEIASVEDSASMNEKVNLV